MNNKFKVMTKGGKSYIKVGYSGVFRVNGFLMERANGDSDWLVFKGDVASIEQKRVTAGALIGWKRRDGAPESLPDAVPLGSFVYDSEEYEWRSATGFDPNCFEAVHAEPVVTWDSCDFEVIDRDCEPVEMESWAVVDWPANIERYREQQHKFPCHITAKELFKLAADAVIEVASQHRQEFDVHDCRSIGLIAVSKLVEIPQVLRRKETVDDTPWGSKRKRTKVITRTTRKVEILRYNGFYDKRDHGEIYTPQLSAPNYAALKQAVQQHIDSIVAMVRPERWCLCESCDGTGIRASVE